MGGIDQLRHFGPVPGTLSPAMIGPKGWPMLLFMLAAAMLEPLPLLPEPGYFPWAHVVSATPRSGGASGVVMFYSEFHVQTLDGRRHKMMMAGHGPSQSVPPVGSICWIRFDAIRPYPGTGGDGTNFVRELGCGAASASQRDRPSAR